MTAPPVEQRVAVWDQYPAQLTVTAPDGTRHVNCRVILCRPTQDAPAWAWIWTDTRPNPTVMWSGEWAPGETTPTPRGPWKLATPDGQWRVEKGRGCGCYSPLKRMKPWGDPMRRGTL